MRSWLAFLLLPLMVLAQSHPCCWLSGPVETCHKSSPASSSAQAPMSAADHSCCPKAASEGDAGILPRDENSASGSANTSTDPAPLKDCCLAAADSLAVTPHGDRDFPSLSGFALPLAWAEVTPFLLPTFASSLGIPAKKGLGPPRFLVTRRLLC